MHKFDQASIPGHLNALIPPGINSNAQIRPILLGITEVVESTLGKVGFFYAILFADSEYTTLFETPSILSELQPIKVW